MWNNFHSGCGNIAEKLLRIGIYWNITSGTAGKSLIIYHHLFIILFIHVLIERLKTHCKIWVFLFLPFYIYENFNIKTKKSKKLPSPFTSPNLFTLNVWFYVWFNGKAIYPSGYGKQAIYIREFGIRPPFATL